MDDVDLTTLDPMRMFILSTDTLRGTKTDQTIPPNSHWSDTPPQFPRFGTRGRELHILKLLCRVDSIPPSLRCATWVTSTVRVARTLTSTLTSTSNNTQSLSEVEEFGTLKKVRILEYGWETVRKTMFSDVSDEETAIANYADLHFGLGKVALEIMMLDDCTPQHAPVPLSIGRNSGNARGREGSGGVNVTSKDGGIASLARVLYAIRHVVGMEYCPLLPQLAFLLLTVMPEAYAYTTLRELCKSSTYFLPTSRVDHVATTRTFAVLLKSRYPETYAVMEACGALTPKSLGVLFQRFMVTLLRWDDVLRLMDLYTVEGIKIIHRLGVTLCAFCHAHLPTSRYILNDGTTTPQSFWEGVRFVARSDVFRFGALVEKSYGTAALIMPPPVRWIRRNATFPRREYIQRLNDDHAAWAARYVEDGQFEEGDVTSLATHNNTGADTSNNRVPATTSKPVGLVRTTSDYPAVLLRNAHERSLIASWLPPSFQSTVKLDLIYSTDCDGRSVRSFYDHCCHSKHTLTVLEVLVNPDTNTPAAAVDSNNGSGKMLIGMFVSQTWKHTPNDKPYGNGQCFLFRLNPNHVCYKWSHTHLPTHNHTDNHTDQPSNDEQEQANNNAATKCMRSTMDYLALGKTSNGGYGLRLNDDLSKGRSSPNALGFRNEPLASVNHWGGLSHDNSNYNNNNNNNTIDARTQTTATQVLPLGDFEIGLVEVYRMVREVDGKPVDEIDGDPWKNLFT